MIRSLICAVLLAVATPASVWGQDGAELVGPAELQHQLDTAREELARLRRSLVEAGPTGFQAAGGDTALDRINEMEDGLTRLTDSVEMMDSRLAGAVEQLSARLDELSFRLCEVQPQCDLGAFGDGALPDVSPRGGVATSSGAVDPDEFAIAQQQFDAGDYAGAAREFARLAERFDDRLPHAEARFREAVAWRAADDTEAASWAFLQAFAANPDGPQSLNALIGTAELLEGRGDTAAACILLLEVRMRSEDLLPAEAEAGLERLACLGPIPAPS